MNSLTAMIILIVVLVIALFGCLAFVFIASERESRQRFERLITSGQLRYADDYLVDRRVDIVDGDLDEFGLPLRWQEWGDKSGNPPGEVSDE